MFDFAWTEIGLIGVVAMILIGPKDMPVAIKAVSDMVKKARRMAGEFQGHVDEMLRDSNLSEVRDSLNEIRNMDIRGELTRAVDADGSLRATFTEDPFQPTPISPDLASSGDAARVEGSVSFAPQPTAEPARMEAPAFIPPDAIPPPPVAAPAFIPPDCTRPDSLRPGR